MDENVGIFGKRMHELIIAGISKEAHSLVGRMAGSPALSRFAGSITVPVHPQFCVGEILMDQSEGFNQYFTIFAFAKI